MINLNGKANKQANVLLVVFDLILLFIPLIVYSSTSVHLTLILRKKHNLEYKSIKGSSILLTSCVAASFVLNIVFYILMF